MKPEIKGLIAAFAAIALMTSWGALAANDESGAPIHNVEATVFVDKKNGGDAKDVKKADVTIEAQPLGGGKAKCTNQNKQEYQSTTRDGDRLYPLQTSAKPGDDYGRAYFFHCVRGMYQISVVPPAGFKISSQSQQHQIIKVEQNKSANLEFILEQL